MTASRSLSSRLSMYIITAVATLFAISITGLALFAYSTIKEEANENLSNMLEAMVADVNILLNQVEAAADASEWIVKEHLDDPDIMFGLTERLVLGNSSIIGSTVAFEPDHFPQKGKYFAPYSYAPEGSHDVHSFQMGNDDYDYFNMEWYTRPKTLKKNVWSDPYFDQGGGGQMMTTYSIPLTDRQGTFVAVMTADMSLKELTDKIADIDISENSSVFLVGSTGTYISHPDTSRILKGSVFDPEGEGGDDDLVEIGAHMIDGGSGQCIIDVNGEKNIMIYRPISNGWSLAMMSPYSDIFGGLKKINRMLWLIAIFGIILLYQISSKIIRRTTQPITEFTYSAHTIAKGNFNAKLPDVKSKDEILRLRDSLQYMQKSVRSYIDELRTTTASNERFESELNIASAIQMQMLPTDFPMIDDVDLRAALRPAKEVGGDLYDFCLRNRTLYFAIGDVSGKGMPAAMYMAITRYALRFVSGMGLSLGKVLSEVNKSLSDGNDSNMFVTIFIGKLNLDTLELEYCNGGHNPIITISPSGKAEFLHAKSNLALGLFEGFPFETEHITLEKGSRLLLYTDGVSEAEDAHKNLFGDDRLLSYASSAPVDATSAEFIEGLSNSVKTFVGDNEQNDDITMMSIKIR